LRAERSSSSSPTPAATLRGAKTKTQDLIEHNKVHVIIGPLATFEALAIDDHIKEAKVPLSTPTSAAQNDLAQQKRNDFVIHAVGTAAQPMHTVGEYAARKLGYKRVATIAIRLHLRPRRRSRIPA
jgi:branched-chain amino acid transport system substrate-binding protein